MQGEISIRVRYAETDRMGLLHHANYLVYFEQGRTELLRSRGLSYRDLEDQGFLLVLTKVQVEHLKVWRDTYYTVDHSGTSDVEGMSAEGWSDPAAWDRLRNLDKFKTMYVQPGHFLCMGDNSTQSSDGRDWGLVPERLMLGRALLVYFPFQRAGPIR